MMIPNVETVLALVNAIAPFDTAEDWDNVGLLCGRKTNEVHGIVCALDLTPHVLNFAAEHGADLIITHHPILFRGSKNLCEDDAQGRLLAQLVRDRMNLIAAHTCFDAACPGVNDALAQRLSLTDIRSHEPYLRMGQTTCGTLGALASFARTALGDVVRVYGDPSTPVKNVAVLGGSGGDFARDALACGADVFITGEISHHTATDAVMDGLCVLECGHAATERPSIFLLHRALQARLNALQYNVNIYNVEDKA